jgi:quinol monooxygenase YgiN
MANAVFFVSFKLKKGASAEEFLKAAEALNEGYMSKQPGFISWQQLVDGDIWADYITFESVEDARKMEAHEPNELALEFYSYINLNSCKTHMFLVERSY